MKEAIVSADATVTIRDDAPIPTPEPDEVLVKVMVAGTNSKDWKFPTLETPHNSGDDVAGIVEAVGDKVWEFRPGDRVAGMNAFSSSGGAYAEYATLPTHQTFRIPNNISFEEAATVPLAALTAAFALLYTLELPSLYQRRPDRPTPLLIYGASTAVGAYAIKIAASCSIHPVVAVGSANSEFVKPFLIAEEGDSFIDYTAYSTPDELADAIQEAFMLTGVPLGRPAYALDAVSMPGTFDKVVARAMAGDPIDGQKPHMAVLLPGIDYSTADPTVEISELYMGVVHHGGEVGRRFAYMACRLFSLGLAEGWLVPHPHEVCEQGLEGLQEVLKRSKEGKIRGMSVVLRIGRE